MPVWRDIEKRHEQLRTDRAREESVWRELAICLEEDGGDQLNVRSDSRRPSITCMDSTALYAKDDFVGGLFTEAVNPAERWFEYTLDDTDLAKYGPVAKYLWDRAAINRNSLDPGSSGFYVQATPWFSDMATFGGGHMALEEVPRRDGLRIVDQALPMREIFKAVDAEGMTNRIHREFMLTGEQAKTKWPDRAPATQRDDQSCLYVHAIYENADYRPGAIGNAGKSWLSCYVSPDQRDFSVEKGYYEMPIHAIEWKRRSGRVWATGPGHKARADINLLEEMQRSMITALQFEAEPMWLVANEDVMTAADVMPNRVINGAVNAQGKPLAMPLARGENLHMPETEKQAIRTAIREGFHFGLLQLINRPQMTAAEFLGWKEEKLRLLAPHLVCLHRGLGSYVVRRDAILERAGRMPPPPPELYNQRIKIKFSSPFAQVQKATKARAANQLGTAALALQPLFPDIGDNLDGDNIARAMHDGLSGDPSLVRDQRDVEALRQRRAQQMEQDAALARGAQQASIVADVAHAKQAMTSAGMRGKAA